MIDAKQLRQESARCFRLALGVSRRFSDELNDRGWDLLRQAQNIEREDQGTPRADND